MRDLDKVPFHGGPYVRLGEEGAGGLHPEDAVQHPQPLVQQVGRIGLQEAHALPRHHLHQIDQLQLQVIIPWTLPASRGCFITWRTCFPSPRVMLLLALTSI